MEIDLNGDPKMGDAGQPDDPQERVARSKALFGLSKVATFEEEKDLKAELLDWRSRVGGADHVPVVLGLVDAGVDDIHCPF